MGGLSSSLEYTPGESTRLDELDEAGEEGTMAVVRRCGVRLVIVDGLLPIGIGVARGELERTGNDGETRDSVTLKPATDNPLAEPSSLGGLPFVGLPVKADSGFGLAAVVGVGKTGVAPVAMTGVAGEDSAGAGLLVLSPVPTAVGIRRI